MKSLKTIESLESDDVAKILAIADSKIQAESSLNFSESFAKRMEPFLSPSAVLTAQHTRGGVLALVRMCGNSITVLFFDGIEENPSTLYSKKIIASKNSTIVSCSIHPNGQVCYFGILTKRNASKDVLVVKCYSLQRKFQFLSKFEADRFTSLVWHSNRLALFFGRRLADVTTVYKFEVPVRQSLRAYPELVFSSPDGWIQLQAHDSSSRLVFSRWRTSGVQSELLFYDFISESLISPLGNTSANFSPTYLGEISGSQCATMLNKNGGTHLVLFGVNEIESKCTKVLSLRRGRILGAIELPRGVLLTVRINGKDFLQFYQVTLGRFKRLWSVPFPFWQIRSIELLEDDNVLLLVESYCTPSALIFFSLKSKKLIPLPVRKPYNPTLSLSNSCLLKTTASDGFRLQSKVVGDLKPGMTVLLSGYGGFGLDSIPKYSAVCAAWLENGGVFVEAGVRGGMEYGLKEMISSRESGKRKVVQDFLDIAAHIHSLGCKIVASGYSHGAFLASAAVFGMPELFKGLVIGDGIYDLERFHRSGAGLHWVQEFGTPGKKSPWLKELSPLRRAVNLKAGAIGFPKIFLMARLDDKVVHPSHSIKLFKALLDKGIDLNFFASRSGPHGSFSNSDSAFRYNLLRISFLYQFLQPCQTPCT